MYSYPGTWKNYDDLEEHLTREELFELLAKSREISFEKMKFQAALKGIDLEQHSKKNTSFEEIERRARARILGQSEEEMDLEGLINIEYEDE